MSIAQRLRELGITLPKPTTPVANYVPWRIGGGLLFLSGVGPQQVDPAFPTGQVTRELSVEQAYQGPGCAGWRCSATPRARSARWSGWRRCLRCSAW